MVTTERRLARAVLMSGWFSRRQAYQRDDHDESSCSLCRGHGGYHDYGLHWHEPDCPIRLACSVLNTDDPLGYSNDAWDADQRKRDMRE